jgi:hypothetical protein
MKRFHVHVAVNELAESIRFYSAVFGAEPSVLKDDYAKWMLDDPRINFAIWAFKSKAMTNCTRCTLDWKLPTRHRLSRADRLVATQSQTSIGSPTRRGSRGKRFIRWKISPSLARTLKLS